MYKGNALRYFDPRNVEEPEPEFEQKNWAAAKALNGGAQFSIVFTSPLHEEGVCITGETDLHYALVCVAGGHVLPYPIFEDMAGEVFRAQDRESSPNLVFVPLKEFEGWVRKTFAALRVTEVFYGDGRPAGVEYSHGYRMPRVGMLVSHEGRAKLSCFVGFVEAYSGSFEDRREAIREGLEKAGSVFVRFVERSSWDYMGVIPKDLHYGGFFWKAVLKTNPSVAEDLRWGRICRSWMEPALKEVPFTVTLRHMGSGMVDVEFRGFGWVEKVDLVSVFRVYQEGVPNQAVARLLGLRGWVPE